MCGCGVLRSKAHFSESPTTPTTPKTSFGFYNSFYNSCCLMDGIPQLLPGWPRNSRTDRKRSNFKKKARLAHNEKLLREWHGLGSALTVSTAAGQPGKRHQRLLGACFGLTVNRFLVFCFLLSNFCEAAGAWTTCSRDWRGLEHKPKIATS